MTPEIVADFMVSLANIPKNAHILEPSSGEGVFLSALKKNSWHNITAYEIDPTLAQQPEVRNASFVTANITTAFDLVIGNPPYIRWKNLEPELKSELENHPLWNTYCNALCDYSAIFILKAISLLKNGGQLIFITPEYWLNTTHSIKLRNFMLEQGYFEAIYHFNETPMFEGANVSLIIFKFIKAPSVHKPDIDFTQYHDRKKITAAALSALKNKHPLADAEYFSLPPFEHNKKWLLIPAATAQSLAQFEQACQPRTSDSLFPEGFHTISEVCDIGNGMVSGLDKAFQLSSAAWTEKEKEKIIKVVKAKQIAPYHALGTTDYFLLPEGEVSSEAELAQDYPNFYISLLEYKTQLNARYRYNRDIKYWEWCFLRNYKQFSSRQPRILVPCKERISNKNYFRFCFAEEDIYPTQDVTAIFPKKTTKESIYYILGFLNHWRVFDWLRFNGVVKGDIVEFSEKPIGSIPYRKIDFSSNNEKKLHDDIVTLVKTHLKHKDACLIEKINLNFDKLLIVK